MAESDNHSDMLDVIMPWIGVYITAASAVCVLAMAIDAINGIRSKKLWFPCKYFSLNAASLTLLAIAVKFLLDLNTQINDMGTADKLATLTSAAFIPAAMSNFLPSMGCMSDKAIMSNSIGLGLLVITIVVNIWIPSILYAEYMSLFAAYFVWIPTSLMLLSLATVVSSAIALPSTKRSLESKYQVMCVALREQEKLLHKREYGDQIERMVGEMKKYLVMSETSNPQFVMSRSVIVSTTSSAICVYAATAFTLLFVEVFVMEKSLGDSECAYKETTKWMWVTQFIGITMASIVSTFRWFVSISFKCPTNLETLKQVLRIERQWVEALVYWRDSFTILQIGYFHKCRKYLHTAKWFALTYCISLQFFFVLVSKLALIISILVVTPIFLCFNCIKESWVTCSRVRLESAGTTTDDSMVNLRRYVLLLEGEGKLPNWILKSICQRADNLIQRGRKQQPKKLKDLLTNKFKDFNGVREFHNIQVKRLLSHEPPNCWALPLVTLTSVVITLQNIAEHNAMELVRGINEGLLLVKLIDKNLDTNGRVSDVRKVADVTWVGVVVYGKWQGINLKRESIKCKSAKEALEKLRDSAKRTISKFMEGKKDSTENHPNWPAKVISANSMYRITQTILTSGKGEKVQTDGELFDQLCAMIAGILAACLTNLPSLIMRMCRLEAMEKREESICEAIQLLGRTEKVIEFLQKHEWPCVDRDNATSIDDWRTEEGI